ncbi:NADP-dependent oxidoreductase domain-containing protein [Amanita rubescens]|nr:NADP-dependent oxidoreductase domain-containing protein [Amanita rubescens]
MSSQPANFETFEMGPFTVPRIWNGLWQLSSNAWESASSPAIRAAMRRYSNVGYIAYADHYGSAEIVFGQFRHEHPQPNLIIGATKWCVFGDGENVTRLGVMRAVRERMKRMQTSRIDHLQFYWQNYSSQKYVFCLNILRELQQNGLIMSIGLCNFDSIRTDEICTSLGPGIITTNQVQFSLVDLRPLYAMAGVCQKHDLKLLTYGTLCGGFLAEKWVGLPEPDLYCKKTTPSQRKYLDIIVNAWGTWELFQSLLRLLQKIGNRHSATISNVATRWVLDHSFVGAVIIGTRLGITDHAEENTKVFSFSLTPQDKEDIEGLLKESNGPRLIHTIGDCGLEYRGNRVV